MKKKEKKLVVIVGCGRLGSMAAGSLYEQGMEVSVIDENEDAFGRLPSTFGNLRLSDMLRTWTSCRKRNYPRVRCYLLDEL